MQALQDMDEDDADEFDMRLMNYVPGEIMRHITADHDHQELWSNDVRPITILRVCGKMDLFGKKTDEIASLWNDFTTTIQKLTFEYDGYVVDTSAGKDDTCFMMCAFGLAPKQHADDAMRGVLAALGMVEQCIVKRVLNSCKASVSSGPCFTGSVGIKECRRIVVLGEAVNISERNLGIISEGVIHDLNTSLAIGKSLPQVSVKENCFRPYKGSSMTGAYRTALETLHKFRRENQLRVAPSSLYKMSKPCAELKKHIMAWCNDTNRNQKSRVVVVEGPIGSGKSEMISHCLSDEKIHRVARVLYTYADHFKNHLSFSGWANVVKEFLVKSQGEENKKSQATVMYKLLAPYPKIREALPLLNDLLDFDLPLTSECREARKSKEMLECTKRVLFYCLVSEIMKKNDTIVTIDDAMYFDELSWSLINDLKSGAQSLMVCFVCVCVCVFLSNNNKNDSNNNNTPF